MRFFASHMVRMLLLLVLFVNSTLSITSPHVLLSSWEEHVAGLLEQKHQKSKIVVSFECETLKAEEAAEDHIKKFMPKLSGLDAVGNLSCLHTFAAI